MRPLKTVCPCLDRTLLAQFTFLGRVLLLYCTTREVPAADSARQNQAEAGSAATFEEIFSLEVNITNLGFYIRYTVITEQEMS